MQNGFIDFIDIKLQPSRVTRYVVRNYINSMYQFMMDCNEQEELSIRHGFLCEAIFAARSFGLISDNVEDSLYKKADKSFWSRSDLLREREENE